MNKKALSFDDITLVPNYNEIASRKDVDTFVKFGNLNLEIPIVSAAMDSVTDHRMAQKMRQLGGLGFLHRFCSIEDNVRMYRDVKSGYEAVVSLGINERLDRFLALYRAGARYFSLDLAHAHTKQAGDFIKRLKDCNLAITLVAGSVCTRKGAEFLDKCGADIIRVGVGPGSVCSTRVKTGFGIPQFSAIMDCAGATNKPIIADGGIRNSGDAIKSIVAGADFCMLGGMFAGTDETPGEVWETTSSAGRKYKCFRGMASKAAQDDFMGSMNNWKTAEGIEIKVDYKGPVANIVSDLMGGIRSGLTYGGCQNLAELKTKVKWVEVTASAVAEGKPHGKGRL